MQTPDFLDRDLPVAEFGTLPRHGGAGTPVAEARLRDLRAILRQARGRTIRPRGTYSKRSA